MKIRMLSIPFEFERPLLAMDPAEWEKVSSPLVYVLFSGFKWNRTRSRCYVGKTANPQHRKRGHRLVLEFLPHALLIPAAEEHLDSLEKTFIENIPCRNKVHNWPKCTDWRVFDSLVAIAQSEYVLPERIDLRLPVHFLGGQHPIISRARCEEYRVLIGRELHKFRSLDHALAIALSRARAV